MEKTKLTKKQIAIITVCALAIIGIVIAIVVIQNKTEDEVLPNTVDEEMTEPLVELEIFSDDEYYGVYDIELDSTEKAYIERFLETYSVPNMVELWTRLANYQLTSDVYFEDYEGNRVVPANTTKPFIIYFAGVWQDNKGAWVVDEVSEDVARMKALSGQGDPDVYIIPYSTDVPKEAIRSLLANSEYFYAVDRPMAELYNLVDGFFNVCIYFNADGTPAFALKNSNIINIIEYCDYVFETKLTLAEVMDSIKDTVGGKAHEGIFE